MRLRYAPIMRFVEIVNGSNCQELPGRTFRVRFWRRPTPESAENLTDFRLSEIDDVSQALDWMNSHAAGRRSELFLEVEQSWESRTGVNDVVVLIKLTSEDSLTNANSTSVVFTPSPC